MFRTATFILPFCLLAACSADNTFMDRGSAKDTANPVDTADDSEGTDVDESDTPVYWSLSGSLSIENGEVMVAESSLDLTFWNSEDTQCTYAVTLNNAIQAFNLRPDPNLYGWWGLEFSYPGSQIDCPWTLKGIQGDTDAISTLYLGIGPFDSRLEGALSASGVDPNNSSTHALFLKAPQDTESLLVFGVAGTEAQYTQPDGFEASNPLQSETYRLTALYLFPY